MSDRHIDDALQASDEIGVGQIVRTLWHGKWLIAGMTCICGLVAVVVALLLPDTYRAEATLAARQEGPSGLSALTSRYGGIAALAGVELPSAGTGKKALGLKILSSRIFLADFVDRHDLLVPLFAAAGWDRATGELRIDHEIYDPETRQWTRRVKPPRSGIPGPQEAHDEFLKIMSISEEKDTGFVTVAIEHISPIVAKQWVDWLVADLNQTLLGMDVDEAERAIEYLEDKVSATSLAGLQGVLFRLIEEQTKVVMLASVSPEYVFRTIDPAVVPYERAKPRRILIVAAAGVFGLALSVIWVLLVNGQTNDSRSRSCISPDDA